MRYASIRNMDITNGDGIRVSIFFQGCKFRCKGCWNESTWGFDGGKEFTKSVEDKFIELAKQNHITGISILGGEPFNQPPQEILELLKNIKSKVKKPVWLWTGYDFESIPSEYIECLNYLDVIITGRFIEELKDFKLLYRGSSNQIILRKEGMIWKKSGEM